MSLLILLNYSQDGMAQLCESELQRLAALRDGCLALPAELTLGCFRLRAHSVHVREHSSAEERCGPHVAISPVMLRSSNALSALLAERGAGAPGDAASLHALCAQGTMIIVMPSLPAATCHAHSGPPCPLPVSRPQRPTVPTARVTPTAAHRAHCSSSPCGGPPLTRVTLGAQ